MSCLQEDPGIRDRLTRRAIHNTALNQRAFGHGHRTCAQRRLQAVLTVALPDDGGTGIEIDDEIDQLTGYDRQPGVFTCQRSTQRAGWKYLLVLPEGETRRTRKL